MSSKKIIWELGKIEVELKEDSGLKSWESRVNPQLTNEFCCRVEMFVSPTLLMSMQDMQDKFTSWMLVSRELTVMEKSESEGWKIGVQRTRRRKRIKREVLGEKRLHKNCGWHIFHFLSGRIICYRRWGREFNQEIWIVSRLLGWYV